MIQPTTLTSRRNGTGGRPSKCTPQLTAAIADAIRKGMSFEGAGAAAGITPRVAYHWLSLAREMDAEASETDGRYFRFFQAVQGARAAFEAECVQAVVRAAQSYVEEQFAVDIDGATGAVTQRGKKRVKKRGDWKAAAWLLERRFPGEWGNVVRNEPVGQMVQVAFDLPDNGRRVLPSGDC